MTILDNIWIINLKRSKDRLDNISQNMKKHKLKFNVFEAFDGKLISDDEIQKNTSFLCKTIFCNKSMLGCSKSHTELWKQLINDKNTNYYLICEDDVILNETFLNLFPKIEEKIVEHDVDFLSFFCSGLIGCGITPKFEVNGIKFGTPFFPLSLPAYIISKKGAKKLIDEFNDSFDGAIDARVALFSLKGKLNLYLSDRNIVHRNDEIQSTIKTTKHNLKSIIHTIARHVNYSTLSWELEYPVLILFFEYEITWLIVLVFVLILLNYFYFKNEIFGLFLLIETLLIFS
jgi:GR25 family glycosyltransferase involved in LPS biosynthesis